jgi:transcriptional regulator with GAF, ATPase, and Fis domain
MRRAGTFAAVAQWIADAARRIPLVIAVDDLDACDAGTRDLVRWIAHALPAETRALVLVTRGPMRDHSDSIAVRLAPLTPDDVATMVRASAGRDDAVLARRVHAHTGGNLLHVVETLRALAARGFPPSDSLDDLPVPARLEDLSRAELAAAPPAARELCATLAALRRPASFALVTAIVGRGMMKGFEAASALGLIVRDAAGALWFSRASLVGASAPTRALHAACARALAAHGGSADEIARHEVLAGDARAALARGLPAAERLARAHDHAAALELCAAILAVVAPRGRAKSQAVREVILRTAELARLAGDAIRAEAVLAPLLARGSGATDTERDRARVTLARAKEEAGDPDAAATLYAQVKRGPAALDAARDLARLHMKRGRFAEAIALVDEAIARHPDAPELVAAGAFARGMRGEDVTARLAELDAVAHRARAARDHAALGTTENYGAILSFRTGDYAGARTRYQAALTALETTGDVARIANVRMNLASILFHQGEYARCLAVLGETVALLRAAGADAVGTWARRNLGHLYVELGAYQRARVELVAAQADAVRLGLARHRAAAHALLGTIAARTGDPETARAELARARILYGESGDWRTAAEVDLDLAEIEVAAGSPQAARALLEQATAGAQAADAVDVRARRVAITAEIAAASHDAQTAREALTPLAGVIEEVRAQGGRHLEWTLHLAAAAAARAIGDLAAASSHQSAARGLLEAMAIDLSPELRAAFWADPRRRSLHASSSLRAAAPSSRSWLDTQANNEGVYRILEIYRRLNSELDLARLLELAMDAAVELTGAERGFLLLADEPGGSLRIAVARNVAPTALAEEARYSRSIAESVFVRGEPVIASSAHGDDRFAEAHSVHLHRVESVLCIPVRVRGRTAGVLYLENRLYAGRFHKDDLRLLLAFGDQVAIALENARLYSENARRAAELGAAKQEIDALYAERGRLLAQRTEELAIARRDLDEVRARLARGAGAMGIVGKSPAMARVLALVERVAAADVPVAIEGESGTGKELVARALHEHGPRRKGPLVTLNCGALPEALLESELFGHVKGAFTGADRDRRGLFQAADGGTLFLDEVGDMPARMQADLLRALQEKTIRPVGATRDLAVDVRVVAAANRPLEELVAAGRFRRDLYYRLHVVTIALPPLRDRPEDVPLLVDHFLDAIALRVQRPKKGVTRAAMRRLMDHPWPGNVRQLEHALMNACVLAESEVLDVADLEAVLSSQRPARSPGGDRREKERTRIVGALEECGWNKSKAAAHLGMPRRTFYRRLAHYRID